MTGQVRGQVEAILDEVVDPCSQAAGTPLGLREMGLVESCAVDGDQVAITLRVTAPQCLFAPLFATEVEDRVAALPGVSAVEVTISDRLDWTEADLLPSAAARLARRRGTSRGRALPLVATASAAGPARLAPLGEGRDPLGSVL